MKQDQPESLFSIGFAKREITPALGAALAGRPIADLRRSKRIRDPLFVRALHLCAPPASVTLVAADLVLVTARMHAAVTKGAGLDPERLLVFATHTHSSPGEYWRGSLLRGFMGRYRDRAFESLVTEMSAAAVQAAEQTTAATVSAGSSRLAGASVCRRRDGGEVDDVLSVVRFDTASGCPLTLLSFGAHAIGGLELEPLTVTADFPGEICQRLEANGLRAMFLPGAVGGTNPEFLSAPTTLDEHLRRMGETLATGIEQLERRLLPVDPRPISSFRFPFHVPEGPLRVLPPVLSRNPVWQGLSWASGLLVKQMVRQGHEDNADLAISMVKFGDVAIVGVPSEVGPGVSLELRQALERSGARVPIVGSLCNGYTGYMHLLREYERTPEKGFRRLALYENAMSAAGWNMGQTVVDTVRSALFESTDVSAQCRRGSRAGP